MLTATPPTIPQTLHLLALSRGDQPYMPPIARNSLLTKKWIVVTGTKRRRDGSDGPVYGCTEAGLRALATSPHRAEAERRLEAAKRSRAWQGLT